MNEGKMLRDTKKADEEFDCSNISFLRHGKSNPNQVTEYINNLLSTIMNPNPELKMQMYEELLSITSSDSSQFFASYINLIHLCVSDFTSRHTTDFQEQALNVINNLTKFEETIKKLSQTKFAQTLISVALSDHPLSMTAFSVLINMATDGSCRFTLESADLINKLDGFLSVIDSDESNDLIVSKCLWLLSNMVDSAVNAERLLEIAARYIRADMRPCHSRALIALKEISHECECNMDVIRSILPLELAIELLRLSDTEVGYAALFAANEIYSTEELAAVPMVVYQSLWRQMDPSGKENISTVVKDIFDEVPSIITNAVLCGFIQDLIEEALGDSFNSASSAAAAVMTATSSAPDSIIPITIDTPFIQAAIELINIERFSCIVVNYLAVLAAASESQFGESIISQLEEADALILLEGAKEDSSVGELIDQIIDTITRTSTK